ncbi:DUF421 domain-containing protein [Erythrobacter sp. R86502]|uniref:DUF421 domain-containing protein n=1 Tax=Erythrobacter sp. R86502 TaxID=3093846 RepID=UPI0036D3FC35
MTAFDFVRTIAAGSLLAGAAQALDWTGFAQAITGMTTLFLFQYLAALARRRSDIAELILQNEPVFPMKDGKLIEEALRKTRVDVSDVYAKLREANALRLSEVHAVVLETTGDISVLHGGSRPDDEVMTNVC